MCNSVSASLEPDRAGACPTATIVTAIARLEGVDPAELQLCLADYVDPDALSALLAHRDAGAPGLTVSFTVEDYVVTVSREAGIRVARPCDDPKTCRPDAGDR